MKAHARKAFNALKKIGAPVFVRDESESCHFVISGEDNCKKTWADYWLTADGLEPEGFRFGVCPEINEILDKYRLFCEWETAGSLCVYDT